MIGCGAVCSGEGCGAVCAEIVLRATGTEPALTPTCVANSGAATAVASNIMAVQMQLCGSGIRVPLYAEHCSITVAQCARTSCVQRSLALVSLA
jgi:hypothetical protein